MTYRQIINAVLRRLREDTISSDWSGTLVDATGVSDYQKLIGDFVNEAKRDVEDAWNWGAMRGISTSSITSGNTSVITSALSNRSRILHVVEKSTGDELKKVSDSWIEKAYLPTDSLESGQPVYYSIQNISESSSKLKYYPKADATYTMSLFTVTPQDDLSSASDSLEVPSEPVILGAWARAISERGEDGGSQTGDVYAMYTKSLSDHIAIDAGNYQDETVWASN